MRATFVVRPQAEGPATTHRAAGPLIVLGRGHGCDVDLGHPSVSHRHATLRVRGETFVVFDEGSVNGTFAGEPATRLTQGIGHVLRGSGTIRCGAVSVEIAIEPGEPLAEDRSTGELALSIAAHIFEEGVLARAPRVVVTRGADRDRVLVLESDGRPYVIGRDPAADLPLGDAAASRRHVRVLRRGARVLVADLSSQNGTELDGVRLEPEREVPWPPGAPLRLSSTTLELESPALTPISPASPASPASRGESSNGARELAWEADGSGAGAGAPDGDHGPRPGSFAWLLRRPAGSRPRISARPALRAALPMAEEHAAPGATTAAPVAGVAEVGVGGAGAGVGVEGGGVAGERRERPGRGGEVDRQEEVGPVARPGAAGRRRWGLEDSVVVGSVALVAAGAAALLWLLWGH